MTPVQAKEFYRSMLLARLFEERAAREYQDGHIGGFLHLYPGEEAVAVGAIQASDQGDYVVSTYREHVHALVKGISPRRIMAELFGKSEGVSGGLGGSMHIFDRSLRFFGGWAIVGETFPVAIGVGYAIRLRNDADVCLCFFGDGAVNQGTFHESLNMAGLWKLPVLFVCENNRYQIGTEIHRHSAVTDMARRASVYGIGTWKADGMDVESVFGVVRMAIEKIRRGEGPQFVECETYRFRGHSMADPSSYRPQAESAGFLLQDPLKMGIFQGCPGKDCLEIFSERCRSGNSLSEEELLSVRQEIEATIDDAVLYARDAREPGIEDLEKAWGIPLWERTSGD
uniref:Pyruvate dehydrogenase (Acetyl-transferring) E1 component subunit alpha n=1 Tax=Leptospirillum ferriphilum TaxID=178606 RepID=A0A7C3QTL5_9BACT